MQNGNDKSPQRQKVILFTPVNAAGHMQSSVAIADKLRADYGYRCVFCIAGPPHTNVIEDHGHELIVCEDAAPLWDYEIGESDGDVAEHLADHEAPSKGQHDKVKRKFEGAHIWPQFVERNRQWFTGDDKESCVGMARLLDMIITWAIKNGDAIDREVQRLGPDLVVADTSIISPTILKHQDTIPWVRLYTPNPVSLLKSKLPDGLRPPPFEGCELYSKEGRARMRTEQPERWQALLDDWKVSSERYCALVTETRAKLEKYYRAVGCKVESSEVRAIRPYSNDSPYMNVYMFPEALDYDQEEDLFEYPPRWLRCDSLLRNTDGKEETVERETWAKLLDEHKGQFKSVVYLSLGSIASGSLDLMKRLIGYLSEDDGETLYIISKGVNGDKVQLDPRNMLGGNYLPQTYLLQRSDLAVLHGGNNGITEALYYGKPVIVLPAFGDQLDNAQRIEDLELGKRLNLYTCTRNQLLGAIKDALANKGLIAKAHAIGEKMRSRDELGKVTHLLRELVEEGHIPDELARRSETLKRVRFLVEKNDEKRVHINFGRSHQKTRPFRQQVCSP